MLFECWFSGQVFFFFYAECGLCACDVVCVEFAEECEDLEVGEEGSAGMDDLHG